ncbi:MAG TPA: FAD-dependent monooxygenase [Candidatus Limnocylindrales bacterium]
MEILISGASIAGPALAFWLSKDGHKVTIVERAPELRDGGYKVDIRGAAIEVARRMGILEEIRAASTNMREARWVDRDNRTLAVLPADFFEGRTGDDEEIMRGDLARILYDRTKDVVEYVFGDSIAALDEGPDGVLVSFERGPDRRFDLVIGADGLHSRVRALTFGDEAQFVKHLGAYVSIYTTPNYLNLDYAELFYGSVDRLVSVYSARDNSEARSLFIFNSPRLDFDRRDAKSVLAQHFDGESWETPRLLEFMRDANDFYFDSVSLVEMPGWSRGRVTLVGDAASCPSPASGQGTGLALVGAYVLAGELAAAGGDHVAAFACYERIMRPYAQANQKFARRAVKAFTATTPGQVRVRNAMMRVLHYMPWKGALAAPTTRLLQRAANDVELKSYQ